MYFGGGGGLITSSLTPIRSTGSAYPTTFFPSAVTAGQASRITLTSGEERSAVVTLRPVPAAALSGVLMDDAGAVPGMGVHLLPGDLNDEASILEFGVTATDNRGAFVFPAVPAGQYTIVVQRSLGVPTGNPQQPTAEPKRMAEQSGAWAIQTVTVGDRAVENLMVQVKRPLTVTGEVHFAGSSPPPAAERIRNVALTIFRTRSLFRAPTGSSGSTIDLANNGRISVRGISLPGRFMAGPPAMPAPWTLESVTLGGRDVTDAAFRIEETDLSDLVITYTDKPAGIAGNVALLANTPDAEVSVFLLPASRARWADARISRNTFRTARTSKAGAFSWTNVPPGDYLVVALADADASDWPDEKFITKLAALATPVKVTSGQPAAVSLNVSVLR